MTARLPLTLNGYFEQLQANGSGTGDYLDCADTGNFLIGGRLTLSSNTPVTTADVTTATPIIYYTPYVHDRISLYNGSIWTTYRFTQFTDSTSLTGATVGQIYDVFLAWNSGSPALSFTAWTNSTTRATGLTQLNGVLVSSSDYTARYLGTVCLSANNTLTDSVTQRYVWNYYNRVDRGMSKSNSTSHTYNSATYREWNGGTTEQIQFVVGQLEDAINVDFVSDNSQPTNTGFMSAYTGVGLDSTSSPLFNVGLNVQSASTIIQERQVGASITVPPSQISTIGPHSFVALEAGSTLNSKTATFSSYTLSATLPM